jgi:hypothetical protein
VGAHRQLVVAQGGVPQVQQPATAGQGRRAGVGDVAGGDLQAVMAVGVQAADEALEQVEHCRLHLARHPGGERDERVGNRGEIVRVKHRLGRADHAGGHAAGTVGGDRRAVGQRRGDDGDLGAHGLHLPVANQVGRDEHLPGGHAGHYALVLRGGCGRDGGRRRQGHPAHCSVDTAPVDLHREVGRRLGVGRRGVREGEVGRGAFLDLDGDPGEQVRRDRGRPHEQLPAGRTRSVGAAVVAVLDVVEPSAVG